MEKVTHNPDLTGYVLYLLKNAEWMIARVTRLINQAISIELPPMYASVSNKSIMNATRVAILLSVG